jgi:hypothetical protein
MNISPKDFERAQNKISQLIGLRPWRAALGHGSFITFDFGKERVPQKQFFYRGKALPLNGEWFLWIYMCAWSLESEDRVLATSESSRSMMQDAIQRLTDLELQSVDLIYPGLETTFVFEKQFTLKTQPLGPSNNDEYWKLYMPDNTVLIIGGEFGYGLVPRD